MFGDARGTLELTAGAAAGLGEVLGPDPASEGSPVQGSFGPTWKGHSFTGADSTRTRGFCGLLLLTKVELKRTCE